MHTLHRFTKKDRKKYNYGGISVPSSVVRLYGVIIITRIGDKWHDIGEQSGFRAGRFFIVLPV